MEDKKEARKQREYIEKMRSVLQDKTASLGHVPTFFIETLGCQMNAKDSEKFAGILTEIGYECVKPDGAFYLFVKTPGGDNRVFCEEAKAKDLLVVPSEPFGVEGYFRLGYCVSKEMIERALPVFKEVFEEM